MNVFALNAKTRTPLVLLLAAAALPAFALGPTYTRAPRTANARSAGCSPATAATELDLNNVRARIETGGNLWQDRPTTSPAYEIPKTPDRSGPDALFAGALWLGGLSPDNQLKLAAVQFRQGGNDYWPGPIEAFAPGSGASTNDAVCRAYDRTWRTRRQDAMRHAAYYRCMLHPEECDLAEEFPEGYTMPPSFAEWPAHGDLALGQAYNLAPFGELEPNGAYEPEAGDYPLYELETGEDDCRRRPRDQAVPLFGDENIWWVFNDKGNAHTESGGQPIGMEIRAQAFAFSTNDEVNNMTFYNYTLINQGSQTLTNTYFGQWVDADVGGASDDFVGCDVQRGLGYAYNGDDQDDDFQGKPGYGAQPPAVGVDFFEGPYTDLDDLDNPVTTDLAVAQAENGIVYPGIGIGYGDGIVDNERLGMRAFVYHNNGNTGANCDPQQTVDYFNYLRAVWRDGTPMTYCGTGYAPNNPGAVRTRYMFPGNSDPLNWATNGVAAPCMWTEEAVGNSPEDRRFLQSAGPFTLLPGALNNITVGVVWARASGGGPQASVEDVRVADDKAQALFDNCFRILDGPVAPDVSISELDRELILYLENDANSNNALEGYAQVDPTIPTSASDRQYRFQGYQVYQVKEATVQASELNDVSRARLLAQCDKADGIGQLINYIFDPVAGLPVPQSMVLGADEGVRHAFSTTQDLFATGDPRLVNFRTYHYMVIAYAHNNYEVYDATARTGQAHTYLPSRRSMSGSIRSYAGIPHPPAPQAGGTQLNSAFGDGFPITRLEGQGQGGNTLDLQQSSVAVIMNGAPWRADELHYAIGKGPADVRVVDPLRVPAADLELFFRDSTPDDLSDAHWTLINTSTGDSVQSEQSITVANEQLVLPWGLAVTIAQPPVDINTVILGSDTIDAVHVPPVSATITFGDPSKAWLGGVPDVDGAGVFNWIKSGTGFSYPDTADNNDRVGIDPEERYESLLGGTWAPWRLCGWEAFQPGRKVILDNNPEFSDLSDLPSVRIVITDDEDLWSRAPVFEMQEEPTLAVGGRGKLELRADASVGKDGMPDGSGTGMGWFPGYAIDMGTGERLNIGFGEDSFWGGAMGRDMRWNPDDKLTTTLGAPLLGGQHWIFVFRNAQRQQGNSLGVPQYDEAAYIQANMGNVAQRFRVWRSIAWVGSAMLVPGRALLESEACIDLNVRLPYQPYTQPFPAYSPPIEPLRNGGLPLYAFSTRSAAVSTQQAEVQESALDLINIVPNPYYGFSGYESGRLDNRVKFINLPQRCTISIYNAGGTLIRRYNKDNGLTYLDWDLRNSSQVPIAGGTYLCHVGVPGAGERVIKWFGVMRPVDLQNF